MIRSYFGASSVPYAPSSKPSGFSRSGGTEPSFRVTYLVYIERTMPSTDPFIDAKTIESIADRIDTPFYVYSAAELRRRLEAIGSVTDGKTIRARYAMKACSVRRVLEEVRAHDVWLDTVSGNEILRAKRAGFAVGSNPPVMLFTADVFRDNSLEVVVQNNITPTIGTPHMVDELAAAGFEGAVGVRLNPGFGHGHVKQCDTGGPASKHGIWYEDESEFRHGVADRGFKITVLHAHIGTGPGLAEFRTNIERLADFFAERIAGYPDVEAVDFGGGIPHPYRPGAPHFDAAECGQVLRKASVELSSRAGRPIRVEIEPGRYFIAGAAAVVARVRGFSETRTNEKGPGHSYLMVDAGFCDLIRPAMYGSYHRIEVLGKSGGGSLKPQVVAGPLCESGDVFTRDAGELLDPRPLPDCEIGDLVLIRDAGAYGYAMSSNYCSTGRVPQVWVDDGKAFLISRREAVDDIVRTECFEEL